MTIWTGSHTFYPSLLRETLSTNDPLPAQRKTIATWVGSPLENMCIRIDDNSLCVTHTIFPGSTNECTMTEQIKSQDRFVGETVFEHDCLGDILIQVFINAALTSKCLFCSARVKLETSAMPAWSSDGLLGVQTKIKHGGE